MYLATCRQSHRFLSTPSARRATFQNWNDKHNHCILSTPSARRATFQNWNDKHNHCISIHALREEGDGLHSACTSCAANFYPRPPRGGRQPRSYDEILNDLFLSTPSARRATICAIPSIAPRMISIHALREEGDLLAGCQEHMGRTISIHALREEGDPFETGRGHTKMIFLSTPSARRATSIFSRIHAGFRHFYPRPPRGGRQSR